MFSFYVSGPPRLTSKLMTGLSNVAFKKKQTLNITHLTFKARKYMCVKCVHSSGQCLNEFTCVNIAELPSKTSSHAVLCSHVNLKVSS